MRETLMLLLPIVELASLGAVWAATSSINVLVAMPHVWANSIGFIFAGLVVLWDIEFF